MQICRVCNKEKPFDDFYKHKNMASGYLKICKKCHNKKTNDNWHSKTIEEKRKSYKDNSYDPIASKKYYTSKKCIENRKEYLNSEKGKKVKKISIVNWINKNKQKRLAHLAVSSAIKSKKLSKLPCIICGNTKVEAHHPDYDQPLSVVWLCSMHHAQLHSEARK